MTHEETKRSMELFATEVSSTTIESIVTVAVNGFRGERQRIGA